jgi:hypothetical protein
MNKVTTSGKAATPLTNDKKWIYAGIAAVIIITIVSVIIFVSWKRRSNEPVKKSPTPSSSPKSPTTTVTAAASPGRSRVGVPKSFTSQRTIVSSESSRTFNYIKDPLTDESTGYFTYGGKNNMLSWSVALPLNFTHAKVFKGADEMIFEFRRPNSSDTYGKFVKGDKNPSNFFTDRMELGTFF